MDGAADGIEHVVGIVVEEGEAVALVSELVVGENGIPQAAGFTDDRDGAIAQRDHLAEAAGLKLAGHEEHVAAGVDAVGQLMVHGKAGGDPARILRLGPGEEVGIFGLAHTENSQLDVGGHEFADDAFNEVKALLIGQAGNDADQRNAGIDIESQFLLELFLTDFLAAQMIRIVVGIDHRILLRGIFIHVNAVENAYQLILAGTKETVKTLAVEGGLDFLSIAGGNGGQFICIDETGFHVVGTAIALQLVGGEEVIAQTQGILNRFDGEDALILQVVDGENRLHVLVEFEVAVLDFEQRGNHAGLPVVAVDDIRLEAEMRKGINHRTGEVAKALVLIAAETIDIGTAEIILIVDKVESDPLILKRADATVLLAPAEDYLEFTFELHLSPVFRRDGGVQRKNHADVHAAAFQNRGECADNVGKTACLDKRNAFGCGE